MRPEPPDAERILWLKLVWMYGKERAARIVCGYDEATEADLVKWRRIGGKSVKGVDGRTD